GQTENNQELSKVWEERENQLIEWNDKLKDELEQTMLIKDDLSRKLEKMNRHLDDCCDSFRREEEKWRQQEKVG
uniref:Uncharacterized protein n=1 Tax=Romanomermis culicivorax TaxID=13658 RepID=A0A915JEY5_ROMCU